MKRTLLEMVQRILESRDMQLVNSIFDTREAMQVANIIKECYIHLLYVREIKSQNTLLSFDSLSDLDHPTYLKFKEDIAQIDLFKYYDKKNEKYNDLQLLQPQDFIDRSLSLNPKDDNITQIVDPSGITINVYNDRAPSYWTSFDDVHVVLDAWDSSVEDTVQETNTVAYGIKIPEFKLEDTFIPDLAPQHFSYLLSKAKVMTAMEFDREYNQLEDDRARKELITANEHARRLKGQVPELWMNRPRSGRHTGYLLRTPVTM